MNKLEKIYNVFQKEGFSGVVLRIRLRFFEKTYIYKASLLNENIFNCMNICNFSIVHMSKNILNKMVDCYREDIQSVKLEAFFSNFENNQVVQQYAVIGNDKDVLGYSSVAFAKKFDPTMDYTYDPGPNGVLIFDMYTFSKHRNKGVQTFALAALLQELKCKGFHSASIMIDEGNLFSEKAIAKKWIQEMRRRVYHFDTV